MEGVCDMFNNDDEEFESNKYKLKQVEFGPIKIFEMDNGEDNVLIGQSLWKGSKVMSKWLMEVNPQMCEGKNVLELGSGIGLCGFTASYLEAKQVVLTDYKRPVMELLAHNISNFKSNHPNNSCITTHSQLDWYFAQDD